MQRSALVTGATGFVGSHLVEQLTSNGWKVRALVRPTSNTGVLRQLGVALETGDLSDVGAIRRAGEGVDVVYHLAAVTGLRREKNFDLANVEGTHNVVEAVRTARARPQRLVYLSSYAACGPAEPGRPRTLSEAPAPLTAYGRTKLAGEKIVQSLDVEGVQTVILRAPAVYGPGDHALLPYFKLVRLGLAPAPAGERWLHMIFVRDLARALQRAADASGGIYPVADPREHSWSEMVAVLATALERRPLRLSLPAGLVRAAAAATEGVSSLFGATAVFNREKAEEMLAPAWICEIAGSETLLPAEDATPLAEGIAETVRWYKRQGWL